MGNMHNTFLCNVYNMSSNICLILGVFLVVFFGSFWYYILVTKIHLKERKKEMKVTTKEPFILVTYAIVKNDGTGIVRTALVPYNMSISTAKLLVTSTLSIAPKYEGEPIVVKTKKVRKYTFNWKDGDTYNDALANSLMHFEGIDIAWTYSDEDTINNIEEPSMEEAMEKAKVN